MKKKKSRVSGFSLVEVALALAIAGFCLITLMALLPLGVARYRDADNQSTMVNLATMVQRDLEVTPTSATATESSPRFNFQVPAAGGTADTNPQIVYVDAAGNVVTGGARIYRINVAFTPPASGNRGVTMARLLITWPAQADAGSTGWPTQYSDMFETTIALNRN